MPVRSTKYAANRKRGRSVNAFKLETEASSEDADKSKPHSDIFLAAVKHSGQVLPQEGVVIGESPYDAEAAGKAGITAIGVLCGGFPEQELRKAGFKEIYTIPQICFNVTNNLCSTKSNPGSEAQPNQLRRTS